MPNLHELARTLRILALDLAIDQNECPDTQYPRPDYPLDNRPRLILRPEHGVRHFWRTELLPHPVLVLALQ